MIEFLRTGNKNYTKKDLIATLEKLEIQEGDTIYVHTELFKFGTALLPKKQHLSVYYRSNVRCYRKKWHFNYACF